ncbi:uncharacterized protein LOC131019567 [Salvia miltiorrhiza]|uniref:uncharacterized protein LOC131019567 n=1 Tax=Salvia miltiorrhiza TaxID=226208 RepID=UPI0025ACC9D0|nr:uncharacterized protein LOC131019567 [Salvia miltiorrhiza]
MSSLARASSLAMLTSLAEVTPLVSTTPLARMTSLANTPPLARMTSLADTPPLARMTSLVYTISLLCTYHSSSAAVFQTWVKYKSEEETPESSSQNKLHINTEDLFELSQFVIGEQPSWGHIKLWQDYDKVIAVVNIANHWITLCINLVEASITV